MRRVPEKWVSITIHSNEIALKSMFEYLIFMRRIQFEIRVVKEDSNITIYDG